MITAAVAMAQEHGSGRASARHHLAAHWSLGPRSAGATRRAAPALLVLFAFATMLSCAHASVFSSTMRWERIGATPHVLKRVPGTDIDCRDWNPNIGVPGEGCVSTELHRLVLFTVDLVLHEKAFTPDANGSPLVLEPGQILHSNPPFEFCSGEGPVDNCEEVQVKVLRVAETTIDGNTQKLIYCVYQQVVYYVRAQGPNATAVFRSTTTEGRRIQRFAQCGVSGDQVCLGPQAGVDQSSCSTCLLGYAEALVSLSTTVLFADACSDCVPTYDTEYWDDYKVYPATNHHSPLVTSLPVITVPYMEYTVPWDESTWVTVSFTVHAVDEDGMGRPKTCRRAGKCNNVNARWDMSGVDTTGLVLEYHSDPVNRDQPGARVGEWIISKRDDDDGGGLLITVEGPLRQPAHTMYPGRIVVSDVVSSAVPVSLEFMLRVCSSIKPYSIDASGVVMLAEGLLAPIIVTTSQKKHSLPSGRVRCFAGQVLDPSSSHTASLLLLSFFSCPNFAL